MGKFQHSVDISDKLFDINLNHGLVYMRRIWYEYMRAYMHVYTYMRVGILLYSKTLTGYIEHYAIASTSKMVNDICYFEFQWYGITCIYMWSGKGLFLNHKGIVHMKIYSETWMNRVSFTVKIAGYKLIFMLGRWEESRYMYMYV